MKSLALLLTLITTFSYSQPNTHAFEYSVRIHDVPQEPRPMFPEFIENAIAKAKFVTYTLWVNENGAKFESHQSPEISDEDYETVLMTSHIDGTYYRKTNDALFYCESKFGYFAKDTIVTKKVITNWRIGASEKIINGYNCFMATAMMHEDFGDGDVMDLYPITAWYCPAIKQSYGPKGIGGLPGLIVELQLRLATFTLKSVDTNLTAIDISLPNKKVITEVERHNLIQAHARKYGRN